MKKLVRLHTAFFLLMGSVPLAQTSLAQEASFTNFCSRALTVDAGVWFADKLDEVEAGLVDGNVTMAEKAHFEATNNLPRTADVDVHVKCVGQALYSRYFELGNDLKRLVSEQRRSDWRARVEAALANGTGADAIVELVPTAARDYANARSFLNEYMGRVDYDRELGAFILPIEETTARQAASAAQGLRAEAEATINSLLLDEQDAFAGDTLPTDGTELASMMNSAESLAAQFTGVAPEAGRAQTRELVLRATASTNVFRSIDEWLSVAGSLAAVSALTTAESRGDDLLAAARNESYSFAVRDDLYDFAVDYYGYAQANRKESAAEEERASIQNALAAERAEREAAIQAAADGLADEAQALAEAAQRASEAIVNTEEERRAFEEEADALEAELGL